MFVPPWPYLKSVIFENNAHLIRYDKLLLRNKAGFIMEKMATKFSQENCLIPGLQGSALQIVKRLLLRSRTLENLGHYEKGEKLHKIRVTAGDCSGGIILGFISLPWASK